MNKIILFLLICSITVLMSCSKSARHDQNPISIAAKPTAKPHKHKHRRIPEGAISLDIINYKNTLHLLTGTHHHGNKALMYQYSADQGTSWSKAVNINASKHIEANLSRGNDARLAVQGNNIVAIWSGRIEGKPHNAGPMQSARSADAGKTWQSSPIPADWTEGSHAFFAMSGNDNAINAVWLDSRNKKTVRGSQGLRFSQTIDGGQSWSSNQTLDNISCACCWNTAKFDASNHFYVLYRDKQPTDMALGVVNPEQQWQRLSSVGAFNWDFPGCPHIGGGLAFQNNDQLLHSVVGSGHTKHLGVHYLRSEDKGKTWATPFQLGDESAIHGDIAANEDGRVIAVWDMNSEDGLSIFYAESTDSGITWSQSKRLSKTGMRATHPRIIANQSNFLTLWTESATGEKQSVKMQIL